MFFGPFCCDALTGSGLVEILSTCAYRGLYCSNQLEYRCWCCFWNYIPEVALDASCSYGNAFIQKYLFSIWELYSRILHLAVSTQEV